MSGVATSLPTNASRPSRNNSRSIRSPLVSEQRFVDAHLKIGPRLFERTGESPSRAFQAFEAFLEIRGREIGRKLLRIGRRHAEQHGVLLRSERPQLSDRVQIRRGPFVRVPLAAAGVRAAQHDAARSVAGCHSHASAKSRASQASNSGWLGGFAECIWSTGITSPRPKKRFQT